MIPILYDSTEQTFTSGGLCYLGDCTYCVVTEERNGIYECEFEYPISGKYYSLIQEERYIACTHDDTGDVQPFRIYKRSAPINGLVTFYAHHLSYKLSGIICEPFSSTNAAGALGNLRTKAINANPFTVECRRAANGSLKIEVPTSARSILAGTEGSILDVYGGELEFDKWTVKLHSARGSATGVTIRYGKNLIDIEHSMDHESVYNAVVPYWRGDITITYEGLETTVTQEDAIKMLPEKIVTASGVTNPVCAVLDLSSEFEEEPTEEQIRTAATSFLSSNKPWEPNENIEVDFIHLRQTHEYKNLAVLQRVRLCDTVSVYYPALGLTVDEIKVVRTEFNVLTNRYDKMELGKARSNFMDHIKADQSEEYNRKLNDVKTVFEVLFENEIARATALLTDPGDSHVLFYKGTMNNSGVISSLQTGNGTLADPEGILIMDTNDPATAQQVLIINKSGIGFSSQGVSGPYTNSWTLDGRFTTDFVATWELMVNQIRLYGLMSVHENPEATYINGVLQDPIGGYVGYGKGRIDNSTTTDGIMLSSTNNLDGSTPSANNRYVIVTTAGTRMTAGDQSFYLTDNLVAGSPSGNAVLTVAHNFVIDAGNKIVVKKGNNEYDGYTGPPSSYEVQIGNGKLNILNGLVIGVTEWTASSYQSDLSSAGGGGGGGGSGTAVAVFG